MFKKTGPVTITTVLEPEGGDNSNVIDEINTNLLNPNFFEKMAKKALKIMQEGKESVQENK
jgi:hypothetical protein